MNWIQRFLERRNGVNEINGEIRTESSGNPGLLCWISPINFERRGGQNEESLQY